MKLEHLLQVAVGNGRHYGGGNTVSPTAGIDDHTLDIYAILAASIREHMNIARLLKDGAFVEHGLGLCGSSFLFCRVGPGLADTRSWFCVAGTT
jgi:hypothetical protein